MAELAFLPRVLIGRTGFGTAVFWDRRQGLLVSTDSGPTRSIAPDELRRSYPAVHALWVRFVALLPEDGASDLRSRGPFGSDGRAAWPTAAADLA
jgi:hypothetical protein